MKHETSTSTPASETKSEAWAAKMAKKKKPIKLGDSEPSNDAKGDRTSHSGLDFAEILKQGDRPKPYYFGNAVTYVTRSGKVLDEGAVKRRIKAPIPIQVHYAGEGANRTIDRVILDED